MSMRRYASFFLCSALAATALIGVPGTAAGVTLDADGSLDGGFSTAMGTGVDGGTRVLSVAVQPDGRTLAGGIFSTFDGTASPSLVRLNADGSLDAAFSAAMGTGLNDYVTKVALQPSGSIVVGGNFTTLNNLDAVRLARLNPDGTPDTAFNAAVLAGGDHSGFDDSVFAIATQPDGKILVGGVFSTLNGVSRPRLVRLNADGNVDEAFHTALASGTGSVINDIALQPDGGILLGSDYPQSLIRLDSTGAVDTAFRDAQGTGFDDEVKSIALQSDGRIVVGGYFTAVSTPGPVRVPTGRVARLSTTGVLDTAFSEKASFDSNVFGVAVQSDDSIVVAGDVLTTVDAVSVRALRLGADGTVDSTYLTNTGDGPNDLVHSVAITPEGRAVLGGRFGTFDSVTSKYLARLIGPSVNLASVTPASGPLLGGPVLTLRGSGFTGIPAVTVGGVACTSPTLISATTITCVPGAHAAGTVDVTVVNDSATPGKTLHLAQAFIYAATAPIYVSGGGGHSCALTPERMLECWGNSNASDVTIAPAGTYTQVSAGFYHSCALAVDASVACWGAGLGGTDFGQVTPPTTGRYGQVSAGAGHSCAVKNDGTLTCWGSDTNGESSAPGGTFTQVSAGGDWNSGAPIGLTCGLRTDSTLACWGSNADGRATPPAGTFSQVAVGSTFACAVSTDYDLACWGTNTDSVVSGAPTAQVSDVSAGGSYACARLLGGSLTCWGRNTRGSTTLTPTGTHTSLSTGSAHSCAVDSQQRVQCWGSDIRGQTGFRSAPQEFVSTSPLASGTLLSPYGVEGAGVQLVVKAQEAAGPTIYFAPATTFNVTSGALPVGVSLSVAGLISGTPTEVGDFTFEVSSTSLFGTRAATFSLTIAPANVTVTASSPIAVRPVTPIPAIGYTTSPVSAPGDWLVQPACAAYSATDIAFATPLSGAQPAGTYVTHCSGGTSSRFTPSTYVNGSLIVDGTKPVATVKSLPILQSTTAFPVAWTASDTGSGVSTTDVRYRRALWSATLPSATRPASFTRWKSAVTARTATFAGTQGYVYCFSTRAHDVSGNASNWSSEKCTTLPLDERTLASTGSWTKSRPTGWVAKTALLTTGKGASLSTKTTVKVKRIGIIALKCATCGSVVVRVGMVTKSVSLVSRSSAGVRTLITVTLSAKTSGKVSLIVTSTGKKVKVDGIALSGS